MLTRTLNFLKIDKFILIYLSNTVDAWCPLDHFHLENTSKIPIDPPATYSSHRFSPSLNFGQSSFNSEVCLHWHRIAEDERNIQKPLYRVGK